MAVTARSICRGSRILRVSSRARLLMEKILSPIAETESPWLTSSYTIFPDRCSSGTIAARLIFSSWKLPRPIVLTNRVIVASATPHSPARSRIRMSLTSWGWSRMYRPIFLSAGLSEGRSPRIFSSSIATLYTERRLSKINFEI